MENLRTSPVFWRVLTTNPVWNNAVKEFNQQWNENRNHWQSTARQELALLDVPKVEQSFAKAMVLSASSILKRRHKIDPLPATVSVKKIHM